MIHAGVVVGSVCRVPNAACSDREPWPKRGSEGCRTASAEARGGGVASPGGASSAGAEGPTGAGRTYPDAAKGTRSGEGRDAADAAALASPVGCPALDLPAEDETSWRSSAGFGRHPGAGDPVRPGEPGVGSPPDPRRAGRAGLSSGSGDGLEHPEQRRAGSCTAVHRSVVARVLPCTGEDDVGV